MKVKNLFFISLLLFVAFISSCASDPKTYSDLHSSGLMQPVPGKSNALLYRNLDIDKARFTQFIIEPVEIYKGADAGFSGVSPADQKTIADFIKDEFTRVISKKYKIVQQPGNNTLRLKFTLAGLEKTKPVMATATRIIPIGLAANLTKSAAGMQGSFTGSITLSGEFYDSVNNALVYAFLTTKGPNAMDITAILSDLDAAKRVITEFAEKFVETIDEIQSKKGK